MLIGIAILAAAALLVMFQRRLIYPAPAPAGAVTAPSFEAVTLATSDGLRLNALYQPPAPGRPTIVFFHGNGDSLRGSLVATSVFAAAGYGVLLPEYRGYGGSPGSPTETGLYADGHAALAFLTSHGVVPHDTVLIGNSLGSGVATQLASEVQVRALVIVSGYTSLPDAVAGALGTGLLNRLVLDRFDSASKLRRVSAPILILHGDRDRVISVEQGRALHAAAASTYREVPGAGHELAYDPRTQQMVADWLAEARARSS